MAEQKTADDGSSVKGNSKRNISKGKEPKKHLVEEDNDSLILKCLQDIQKHQAEYDSKVDGILSWIRHVEETQAKEYNPYYYDDNEYYGEDCEEGEVFYDPPSPKSSNMDINSRFADMAKRFKGNEIVDKDIEATLAENINNLFRKGLEERQHEELIKDEHISRPENCEALVTVKCNRIIWDLCSQNVKYIDKKMQNAETSLIKGAIFITKAVNKLAELEAPAKEKGIELSSVVDQCKDALSLLGHCNQQICLTRRDIIKPELKSEYSHLCKPSVPFTSELFGDDVSKTAKELEDSVKMGHKIQHGSVRVYGRGRPGSVFTNYSQEHSLSFSPRFVTLNVTQLLIG